MYVCLLVRAFRRDRLWIVMEYCGGGSLQDIYHMTGPLSELQIAFVCRETLQGLNYLHSKGKIHRDVKGANILLANSGEVKLADFGVAAQITATIGKRKSFIGTPYWMAPEVASVERKGGYGPQCDVWAVGITAIELAELQPPLFDMHPMQVLYLMTKSSYKPPQLKDKVKWSPFFHEFVKHCLTRNPKKRPSPEKLLTTDHFVLGALSSRLTRDLLDKVNNPGGSGLHRFESLDDEDPVNSSRAPKRIPSRNPQDFAAFVSPMQVNPSNANLSNLWSGNGRKESNDSLLGSIEEELSARGVMPKSEAVSPNSRRGYHNDRTLPANNQPPLPDVVAGKSMLHNDNGVLDDENEIRTLTRDQSAPVFRTAREGTLVAIQPRQGTPEGSSDSDSYQPPVPPPRSNRAASRDGVNRGRRSGSLEERGPVRERSNPSQATRPATCFGLPPTPKVTMGACFSKIFADCPLRINCTASWIHPETKDQLVLVGAEEGIFTLNLNELHEAVMDKIHARRCSWLYVVKDVLMAIQGKTPYVYRHDLVALCQRDLTQKLSKPMNKIPEKFIPRRLAITTRIPETKDCLQCCVQRNSYNGNRYMCAAVPTGVVLMQWYDPLGKFLILKTLNCRFPELPLRPFEMLISPDKDYPLICIGVAKGRDRKHLSFDMIDPNSEATWFAASDADRPEKLDVTAMRQLDKDVVLVCYQNKVQVTSLEGQLKSSRAAPAELLFDFRIESVVCLPDSVLAFHRHGVQGRSFLDGSLTQDLREDSKTYEVLGTD
uniref:Mitogen-activated protein kinase kinase kinase kinase n=1 Tax=Plectus sambesii TaxID=2011161 RepID=A0A914X879_9BILA